MGSIYRPTRKGENGERIKYKCYRIAYRDDRGVRVTEKAFKDKEASKALLRKRELEVERKKAGLRVEEEKKLKMPWHEIVAEYIADMDRIDRSKSHRKGTIGNLRRIQKGTGWRCLADMKREDLIRFLNEKKKEGRAPKTLNHYVDKLCAFLNWVKEQGWIERHPFEGFKRTPIGDDRPFRRRAFTKEEFLQITNLGGPHDLLYKVAGLSGLRYSELKRLERSDVDLSNPEQPVWRLRASATKGKRDEVVPILPECVPVLQEVLRRAEQGARSRLFLRLPSDRTVQRDIRLAGIPRFDERGRRVNFHSFRYFFCTLLGKVLPIQIVRILMRHRDISTTCRVYMDLGLTDVNEAMLKLPKLL